jgi:hypothetical protein
VNVKLPHNFEVQSAKHIFMIEAKLEILGLKGCLVFAFGLNNYMMIHIDNEQYLQPTNMYYNIVWVKDYQNIVAHNARECLSTVTLADESVLPIARTRFFQHECNFFLGGASQ